MTAIIKTGVPNAAQIVIPPNITTLEQLVTWGLRGLWEMHKNSDFFPDKDLPPVRRIQKLPFLNGAGRPAVLWSVYLTNSSDLGIDITKKEWLFTDEITDAVPSSAFNS
jgi:hypothetical protein